MSSDLTTAMSSLRREAAQNLQTLPWSATPSSSPETEPLKKPSVDRITQLWRSAALVEFLPKAYEDPSHESGPSETSQSIHCQGRQGQGWRHWKSLPVRVGGGPGLVPIWPGLNC